jgi:hypothetical protein
MPLAATNVYYLAFMSLFFRAKNKCVKEIYRCNLCCYTEIDMCGKTTAWRNAIKK